MRVIFASPSDLIFSLVPVLQKTSPALTIPSLSNRFGGGSGEMAALFFDLGRTVQNVCDTMVSERRGIGTCWKRVMVQCLKKEQADLVAPVDCPACFRLLIHGILHLDTNTMNCPSNVPISASRVDKFLSLLYLPAQIP